MAFVEWPLVSVALGVYFVADEILEGRSSKLLPGEYSPDAGISRWTDPARGGSAAFYVHVAA